MSLSFLASDVKFYLSGGTNNKSPNKSLGGRPSNKQIGTSINNLFGQVSKTESSLGGSVYRCMYVFNESSYTIQDAIVELSQNAELSNITVGIAKYTEVQQILLGGQPIGGSFVLKYTSNIDGIPVSQETDSIPFNPTPSVMASNIENALNALELLGEVTVGAEYINGYWIYTVTFSGMHDYRDHQLLELTNNSILGDDITINIAVVTEGSPINSIASDIGFENQVPVGVTFSSEVSVGDLNSLDGFGLWIKRVTPAAIEVEENDNDQVVISVEGVIDDDS